MEITLNGQKKKLESPISIQKFLEKQGVDPEQVIIEYNGSLLSKEKWSDTKLQDQDQLEVITFVVGG